MGAAGSRPDVSGGGLGTEGEDSTASADFPEAPRHLSPWLPGSQLCEIITDVGGRRLSLPQPFPLPSFPLSFLSSIFTFKFQTCPLISFKRVHPICTWLKESAKTKAIVKITRPRKVQGFRASSLASASHTSWGSPVSVLLCPQFQVRGDPCGLSWARPFAQGWFSHSLCGIRTGKPCGHRSCGLPQPGFLSQAPWLFSSSHLVTRESWISQGAPWAMGFHPSPLLHWILHLSRSPGLP